MKFGEFVMISQFIEFESESYEAVEAFASSLGEDATEIGFEKYDEFGKFIDKKVFFGCRVNYPHDGVSASVEIRMFPKTKSGSIGILTSSCIAYDKVVKAIQAATGLENLLQ